VKPEKDGKKVAVTEWGKKRERVITMPDYRKQAPCLLERNFEDRVSEMKEQH
jgi:hypothetical protein